MLKNIKGVFLATLLVSMFLSKTAYAMPEILTADQLQPGMQGVAKTVIEGTRIDTFDIEIVGVIGDEKGSDGRIIARASGDVIDKTGGVLQGMSGSPVYVDGRLIGAISGGWKDIDNKTCIITPIADMLKLWDMPDRKNQDKIRQVEIKNVKPEAEADKAAAMPNLGDKPQSEEKNLPDKPLSAPLMVSGFGAAGMQLLQEKLQPFQITPYAVGGTGKSSEPVTIEPGSSVGVEVVRGDVSMAAIGTVTAVDGNRVLAFGHPFLRKGNVNYFMTDAEIVTTASGATSGFKVGVPGNLIGRINQDRSAAIAGVIGEYPSVVPVKVTVEDVQLGQKKTYNMQIAYDEDLLAALVPSIVYNAVDMTIDRTGMGTAQVAFEIMTNSVKNGVFKRDNMFYNVQDVGQIAVGEIAQTLMALCENTGQQADIVGIKVQVKVDENRKTASIVEVMPDKPSAKPGDTIALKIKLKPYRGAEEILAVQYKIPKHQSPGMLNLEVRGGGLVPVPQLLLLQQGIDLSPQEDKMKPLEVKLQEFAEANRNNEIIVNPAPVMPEDPNTTRKVPVKNSPKPTVEAGKSSLPKQETTPGASGQVRQKTAYIIDNVMQAFIKIEKN